MENINITATTTARPSTIPGSTSAFAMSTRGCIFAALDADRSAGQRWIPATGLSTDPSATIRERKVNAKGHVGLVAYTPGNPAWKPPLC